MIKTYFDSLLNFVSFGADDREQESSRQMTKIDFWMIMASL